MATKANGKISVVIVDAQELVRMGIKAGLSDNEQIVVIAEGKTKEDAIRLVNECCPDVLLLGLNVFFRPGMVGGPLAVCDMLKRLVKITPTRILVLSRYDHKGLVQCVLRAGAGGFMLKDEAMESREELAQAIIKIARKGHLPLSSALYEKLYPNSAGVEEIPQLTKRKIEIMQAMADNPQFTPVQVADLLGIAESTLRNNLSAISRALDTPSTNGAMIECLRLGLVQITQERIVY
ncbi:MAG TPA: response regulator transcription factor [Anaerolineae bacterium]|nr:response regulator transcription factor [Anaerolineae bacterium]HIP72962.1 response regulator transcription factor [Anaerolineae bacterium]